MTSVDLGPDSWAIFDQATKGQLDPSKLCLSKTKSKWKLLKSDDVPEGSHISGKQLMSLIKAAAEGHQAIPEELEGVVEENEFKKITSDKRFQSLCKLILVEGGEPGSVEKERAARTLRLATLRRTFDYATSIGKGLAGMEEAGLEGRFVGQENVGNEDFLITELVLRGRTSNEYTAGEIRLMASFWENHPISIQIPASAQSFAIWVRSKEEEWSRTTGLMKDKGRFLTWLAEENAECKYTEDFSKLEGRQPTEDELLLWRDSKDERLTRKAAKLSSIVEPKETAQGNKKGKSEPPALAFDNAEDEGTSKSPKSATAPHTYEEDAEAALPHTYEGDTEAALPHTYEGDTEAAPPPPHERKALSDTSSQDTLPLTGSPGPSESEVARIRQSPPLRMEEARGEFLARRKTEDEEEAKVEKKNWDAFRKFPGALNISLQKYMQWHLEYKESGNPDREETWMLHKVWEEARPSADTPINIYGRELDFVRESDFPTYFQKICFCKELAKKDGLDVRESWKSHSIGFEEMFVQWKAKKEGEIRDRFLKTQLPEESFDKWRQQQDDSEWMPPRPFVALTEEQRTPYCTKVISGRLVRNGHPYDSSSDHSIFHAGKGVGIFVVGPDGELYCGGHVKDVFHHSSFFGSGAIMCGGEIGTTEDGQITFLSNKSGHYTPTEDQNVQMLEWFAKQGVNLDEVTFTYFEKVTMAPLEINASAYLREAKSRAENLKNQWIAFTKLPGAEAISLKQYKAWFNETLPLSYQKNKEMWALKKLWEITSHATDTAYAATLLPEGAADFKSYAQKIMFCKEKAKDADLGVTEWLDANLETFRGEFEEWKKGKEAEVKGRFEKSHLPMSYDTWIEQQDDSGWIPPRNRVSLILEKKLAYKTTVEDGKLVRNGYPYDSGIDRGIAHKERGVGIFFLSTDNTLHCGGYVEGVFDHSTFSGLMSTRSVSYGEIGTDADGRITFLSNKLERGAQGDEQNIKMIRYLADNGVNLHRVRFARYEEGKKEPTEEAASKYLDEAERREEALRQEWATFVELPGAETMDFSQYKSLLSEYKKSGCADNKEEWVLKKVWEKAREEAKLMDKGIMYLSGLSPKKETNFETYFQKIRFCKEKAREEGLGVLTWHNLHKETFDQEFQAWSKSH